MKLKTSLLILSSCFALASCGGGQSSSSSSKEPEKGETVSNPLTLAEYLAKESDDRTWYYFSAKVEESTGSRGDGAYRLFFKEGGKNYTLLVKGASRTAEKKYEENKDKLNFADQFNHNDMKGYEVTFQGQPGLFSNKVTYGNVEYLSNEFSRTVDLQDFSLTTDATKPTHVRKAIVYRGGFDDGRGELYEEVSEQPGQYAMHNGSRSNAFSLAFYNSVPSQLVFTTWGTPDEVGKSFKVYLGNNETTVTIDANHQFTLAGNANITFPSDTTPEIIEISYDAQ